MELELVSTRLNLVRSTMECSQEGAHQVGLLQKLAEPQTTSEFCASGFVVALRRCVVWLSTGEVQWTHSSTAKK